MAVDRPRIASTLMLAGAACTVVCALAGTYMAGGLRTRIVHNEAPSELTVAYLEAWLRGAPTDPDYLSALANQYLALGRCDEAQATAGRLSALGVQQSRRKAVQIELRCDEQRAFAAPPDSSRRAELLARVIARLDTVSQLDWDVAELESLSKQALSVGAPQIAARYALRLAEADAARRVYWQRQAALQWLASGEYRRAADADFAAQAHAQNRDEARDAFIAGVRALQAGNLLDEALNQAQAHLDGLADDRRTLEVLLQLARAAQRPDLVDRYARALMKFVDSRSNEPARAEGLRLAALAGTPPGGVWLRLGAPAHDRPAARFADMPRAASPARMMPAVWHGTRHGGQRGGLLRVADKVPARAWSDTRAAAAIAASQAAGAKAEAEAAASARASATAAARSPGSSAGAPASTDLASTLHQSFLESNDLENAAKVASEQVARHPEQPEWRKRLAQVDEWRNQPAAALQSWLAYARQTGDALGWSNVQRIAPMLNDDASYVQALTHASDAAPDNLQLVDGVIASDERLGRPDDALAFLKARMHGVQQEPIASRYALLSERAGYLRQALDTWQGLQRSHPEKVEYAVHSANLSYRLGDFHAALDALKAARAHATDRDTLYWRTYGQLARLQQDDADSNLAFRHLLAGGEATPEDLSGMTFFYERQPLDAARIAELQYDRGHDVAALREAIDAYLSAHSLERAGALLRRLTPAQQQDAERDPAFLTTRAEYERQSGKLDAALADLRRAIALPGVGGDTRAAYLWMLVDAGSEAEVRAALDHWRTRSLGDESLWGPFAAGEMRLNRPVAALRYLRLQAVSRQRDPLWLLTYADAQEMAGHPGIALSVRRHVWLDLLAAERRTKATATAAAPASTDSNAGNTRSGQPLQRPARSDWESAAQLQGRRAALAQTLANGDTALRLLDSLTSATQADASDASDESDESQRSLLGNTRGLSPLPPPAAGQAEHRRVREAVARDVAVAWAISDERYGVAKRWLARRYAHRLLGTQDERLAIALAEDDVQTIEHLLDARTAALPLYNRIDASMRV
ncbi:tetratricopeptide repeat protein, partial [Trinickia sp.]|uniref:tetratricopeptide repeat protein n=1 Tax=Trinickia sp. TaxID=2571163 RepID=UPI003F7E990F